jgi:hypothetical protein
VPLLAVVAGAGAAAAAAWLARHAGAPPARTLVLVALAAMAPPIAREIIGGDPAARRDGLPARAIRALTLAPALDDRMRPLAERSALLDVFADLARAGARRPVCTQVHALATVVPFSRVPINCHTVADLERAYREGSTHFIAERARRVYRKSWSDPVLEHCRRRARARLHRDLPSAAPQVWHDEAILAAGDNDRYQAQLIEVYDLSEVFGPGPAAARGANSRAPAAAANSASSGSIGIR